MGNKINGLNMEYTRFIRIKIDVDLNCQIFLLANSGMRWMVIYREEWMG